MGHKLLRVSARREDCQPVGCARGLDDTVLTMQVGIGLVSLVLVALTPSPGKHTWKLRVGSW